MNAEEVAQHYLSHHIDWHHYDEDARATLTRLLEQVWNAGAKAADSHTAGDGTNAYQQRVLPAFHLDEKALQRLYDA